VLRPSTGRSESSMKGKNDLPVGCFQSLPWEYPERSLQTGKLEKERERYGTGRIPVQKSICIGGEKKRGGRGQGGGLGRDAEVGKHRSGHPSRGIRKRKLRGVPRETQK